ncbi:arginine--tRNA ligase [Patescibacteria group bacterium]|nr:arginine--tRNA ligase [Patescibacteria group bacterium]
MVKIKEIQKKIVESLKEAITEDLPTDFIFNLERSEQLEQGEFTFPCFQLSQVLKKDPKELARHFKKELDRKNIDFLEKIENVGPYLNFFIKKTNFFKAICQQILEEKDKFGYSSDNQKQKIGIEYSAPNTNKPQHLGHLRNNLLGDSLTSLFRAQGLKVSTFNLINDRGIHICKSMLAYQKWGEGKTPKSEKIKGDHFVGNYYVLFEQKSQEDPSLLTEAQEMLQQWEEGDPHVLDLWQKMNKWALEGIEETYQKLGISFDHVNFESDVYNSGKDIVNKALKKDLCCQREDGAIEIDLEEYNLGKKVLLRPDQTSVYITQDIGLAKIYNDFNLDRFIYVVASEQNHYFRVLFKVLDIFGLNQEGPQREHFSYGLVFLPEGKMKSREGEVVDIDELVKKMEQMAKVEVFKRSPNLSPLEVSTRAQIIAQAALRFFFLKFRPDQKVNFSPEDSLSFEGDTGPYLQYTYARIQSILTKNSKEKKEKEQEINFSLLGTDTEINLAQFLSFFPEIIKRASQERNPSLLAHYLLKLGHQFNEFYHQSNILKSQPDLKAARLQFLLCVAQVLENGLKLLGIKVLSKM